MCVCSGSCHIDLKSMATQQDICSEKLAISHSPTTQLSNQRSVAAISSFSLQHWRFPHDGLTEKNPWLSWPESSSAWRLTISIWNMASLPVTVNVPSHTFSHHIQRISISSSLWSWWREQRVCFWRAGNMLNLSKCNLTHFTAESLHSKPGINSSSVCFLSFPFFKSHFCMI